MVQVFTIFLPPSCFLLPGPENITGKTSGHKENGHEDGSSDLTLFEATLGKIVDNGGDFVGRVRVAGENAGGTGVVAT